MRVVHLCRVASPSVGGMETMVAALAARQRAKGSDVVVVTTQVPLGPGRSWVIDGGVPVRSLHRVGPRRWPIGIGVGEFLHGADVVHVHGIDGLADQALAFRPPGAVVGLSTHGGYLHTRRQWLLKQLWLRTGTRASLARLDAVWFTSEADRRALAPARLQGTVVPNGVELGPLRGVASRRAPELGRWLVLGRVDVHKGLDRLVGALAPVARPLGGTLRVVGPVHDAALVESLRSLAARCDVPLEILGAVSRDAVLDEFARAEFALFPSRREGFGIALVEAMAAGIPVIAQPLPAFVEKVSHGTTGWLVDWDAPAAGEALATFRDADLTALGRASAAAAEDWSWERVTVAWERAYAAALEGR